MLARWLAAFALLGQGVPILGNLLNGAFDSNGTDDGCVLSSYPTLCQDGKVKVLVGEDNTRLLQFGEECATESTVRCLGMVDLKDGSCQQGCGSCPCLFDASTPLSAAYMRTMFKSLDQLCSSLEDTKVLMVGLGGGELAQYLVHRCPNMHVEAVELNGDVIRAARSYFGLKKSEETYGERLKVEQADALDAIRTRDASSYNAVLIDCFAGNGIIPETCRSHEFAEGVKRVLKPKGTLLQNIWRMSPGYERVQKDFKDTLSAYQDVFSGSVEAIRVPMPFDVDFVSVIKASNSQVGSRDVDSKDVSFWLYGSNSGEGSTVDLPSGSRSKVGLAALQVGVTPAAAALRRRSLKALRLRQPDA